MTNDEKQLVEQAILEGPAPVVSADDEARLIAADSKLVDSLAKLECWGAGCTEGVHVHCSGRSFVGAG